MRKSNKQRRISQDRVVSASLEAELLSLLYDTSCSSCSDGACLQRKRCHGGSDEIGRLRGAIESHQCLFVENEQIIKQAHGMLMLKLSELSRKGEKSSDTREALACLEALYGASSISQILDDDEKVVVVGVLLKVLCESSQKEGFECLARLCLSNINTMLVSPKDWQNLQLTEFRDLLIAIAKSLHGEKAINELGIIGAATEGVRQEMVATVQGVISAQHQTSREWNENDCIAILETETKFYVRAKVLIEHQVVDKLLKTVLSQGDQAEYATKCLALAVKHDPENAFLFDVLVKVLLEGTVESKHTAVFGIYAYISGNGANILSSELVSTNLRPLIIAILQIIQSSSHETGKTISFKSAEILGRLFSDSRRVSTNLSLADMVSICTALLENPHVVVSSFMCKTLLDCLSSVSSEYGPLQLEAIEIIAKFTVDRNVDDLVLSRNAIEYYFSTLAKHDASLTDLPRVPHLVESIVKIANCSWERQLLREHCLRLLIRLSTPPLNQRRLARIGGVIPLLIKHVREMEGQDVSLEPPPNFSREAIKSCIQTLAAAI